MPAALTAYRVTGKTLHGRRNCVTRSTRAVELLAGLTADLAPWRPCLNCAADLTAAALRAGAGPTPTVLAVRPVPDDADSWRHEQQPAVLDFHADLVDALGLTRAGNPDSVTPIAYGPLPALTADVLGAQFAVHRLPADADPTPETVALFSTLVRAEPADLRTLPDPGTWTAGRWTVACGILTPAFGAT